MQDSDLLKNITLKEIWNIFTRRLWIIILAAVLVPLLIFISVTITFVPKYSSTATIYILRQTDRELSSTEASTDFSAALKIVNDCSYILKSHTVLDNVIASLNLKKDYTTLYSTITTENPPDTRVLEVTVEASTPEEAKNIVDLICTYGTESINRAMGFEQVNIYEYGTFNETPSNTIPMKIYLISSAAAAFAVLTVFVLVYMLDNSIRTSDDIREFLDISVLGEIPAADIYKRKTNAYNHNIKKDISRSERK